MCGTIDITAAIRAKLDADADDLLRRNFVSMVIDGTLYKSEEDAIAYLEEKRRYKDYLESEIKRWEFYENEQDLYEKQLLEIVNRLREDCEKAIKPYRDKLVQLHAVRTPAITWVTLQQARELGLTKHTQKR